MHKVITTRQITNEKWLNLFETTFEHSKGQGKWLYASRRQLSSSKSLAPNAVIVVPVLLGEPCKLVLIKEYRVPIQDYEYHFPAGLLEPGETVESCVRRELKEEAGFSLEKIHHTSPLLVSSAGMSDETSLLVFADCVADDGKQELEVSEDIEVILLTYRDVCDILQKPFLFAKGAWPVLFMYQQLGALRIK